jgi:hypothetical protein
VWGWGGDIPLGWLVAVGWLVAGDELAGGQGGRGVDGAQSLARGGAGHFSRLVGGWRARLAGSPLGCDARAPEFYLTLIRISHTSFLGWSYTLTVLDNRRGEG